MQYHEIRPKRYPTNILNKDWNRRVCNWFKPSIKFFDEVHNMKIKDDDVWVITLPKSGTTWMQELTWLVMNDFDFEMAKKLDLDERSPMLEMDYCLDEEIDRCFDAIYKLKSPRLIKSHLPLPLLPSQLWEKKAKVIYVFRNPIDSTVSFYYHLRSLGLLLDTTLDEYVLDFKEKNSKMILPFEHATEFYALRDEPWVYYTSFERMKSNLSEVILDVCKFLGKTINDEQMKEMLKHLSFEEMKRNGSTHHNNSFERIRIKREVIEFVPSNFIRKGKVNSYKEELSKDTIDMMDKWLESCLEEYTITLNDLLLIKI